MEFINHKLRWTCREGQIRNLHSHITCLTSSWTPLLASAFCSEFFISRHVKFNIALCRESILAIGRYPSLTSKLNIQIWVLQHDFLFYTTNGFQPPIFIIYYQKMNPTDFLASFFYWITHASLHNSNYQLVGIPC